MPWVTVLGVTACCDYCSPLLLDAMLAAPVPTITRKPQITNIKPFDCTEQDEQLNSTLAAWRDEIAPNILGKTLSRTGGAQLFMSNKIIERIVGLARKQRLRNCEQFAHEISWNPEYISCFAANILDLIVTVHGHPEPPPPPRSQPIPSPALALCDITSQSVNTSIASHHLAKPSRAPRRCGKCHQTGHIRECLFRHYITCTSSDLKQVPIQSALVITYPTKRMR
jgi:hypothetical protein